MEIKHEHETKAKIMPPSLYKVIIHNDDITTMDFVVLILTHIFHKSPHEAIALMMRVHNEGSAICGIYPKDIAYTKQHETVTLARKENFPLVITVEKE